MFKGSNLKYKIILEFTEAMDEAHLTAYIASPALCSNIQTFNAKGSQE